MEPIEAGIKAFEESFEAGVADYDPETWRVAGRATKANPNKEDPDWWRNEGPEMVRRYAKWRYDNPQLVVWETPTGVPAIELEVNVRLEDGTMLRGFIDRIFQDFDRGDLLIVDHKSGSTIPAPIQLASYRLAIQQTFGFSPKWGAYYMARKGTLDTVHDLDRYPPEMVSRWFRDTKRKIELGFFTPHVSRDCTSFCGVRDFCYTQNPDAFKPSFTDDLDLTQEGQ